MLRPVAPHAGEMIAETRFATSPCSACCLLQQHSCSSETVGCLYAVWHGSEEATAIRLIMGYYVLLLNVSLRFVIQLSATIFSQITGARLGILWSIRLSLKSITDVVSPSKQLYLQYVMSLYTTSICYARSCIWLAAPPVRHLLNIT